MPTKPIKKSSGLAFWMQRVLDERDRASLSFAPDPVHDLRVALRRCCSMADGISAIDPDPNWKDMKKAGKRLFRRLGELRDVHVVQEWIHNLDTPGDPVTGPLLQSVAAREPQLQQEALQALSEFDRKQWQRWARSLPRRMARFRPGSLVFRHLALERWNDAHKLHRQTMRSDSPAAFHRLRIGIKRFRYIVENFLPELHAAWSDDLKHMQDLLGEIHDLDVLWPTALRASVFPDDDSRSRWQNRIHQERARRVEAYRQKIKRKNENELWQVWRSQLPDRKQTESAALLRLKFWASSLDPDFEHSRHVARLSLQLYDGLAAMGQASRSAAQERDILRAAALLHDVGRFKDEKGHHKASYRMIRRLPAPLGWRAQDLLTVGIIARYHRGALPRAGQRPLRGLPLAQRQNITRLAAILRLANAFDACRDHRVRRLQVMNGNDGNKNRVLLIAAQGYSSRDNQAEAIAAARHLLEIIYRRPVMIRPMKAPNSKPRPAIRKPETGNRKPASARSQQLEATQSLPSSAPAAYRYTMTHAQLVEKAVHWLRAYRCGVVLSEQACVSGEMPDAIGWKRASHSVLIECKISRADFLADRGKPFRQAQELGLGCERFYFTPPALIQLKELPPGWGLLELRQRKVEVVRRSARDLRTPSGLAYEMNLLLASLRRVEIRIEPQTITEFLKWKNRMQQYNGGACPTGIEPAQEEQNHFLEAAPLESQT